MDGSRQLPAVGYAYAQLASDEITEEHACQQFGLQESQMAKLHARRLSREETCQLISRWRRERVYKRLDVEAVAQQLKPAEFPLATSLQAGASNCAAGRALTDTGDEVLAEIADTKLAQHFHLPAQHVARLPHRRLSKKESLALGRVTGRVLVYDLQAVLKLADELQEWTYVNEEAKLYRAEAKREYKQGLAYDAAAAARAKIRAWKRPRLTLGKTSLPVELWGLVLEQLLKEDSLWDLRATVQELCSISLACKDIYAAVQQQGWPKLSHLLQPFPVTPALRQQGQSQLPDNPDVLVNDPASLQLPQLRAACNHYGIYAAAGTKAEMMTKLLDRFNLSHPCSAPLRVVAHTNAHALRLLRTAHELAEVLPADCEAEPLAVTIKSIVEHTPRELNGMIIFPSSHDHIRAAHQSIVEELARTTAVTIRATKISISVWLPLLDRIADEEMDNP